MGEGIITVNMDGEITWCNKAARKILNCPTKPIVGRLYSKLFLSEPKNTGAIYYTLRIV